MRLIQRITVILFFIVLVLWGASSVITYGRADKENPVITSTSDVLELSVTDDASKLMEGLTATDDQDGDLTDAILVGNQSSLDGSGSSEVTYLVFDSSNNMGEYTRTIRYTDYESPEFSLAMPLVFTVGSDVSILSNLQAADVVDGDISGQIIITSGEVDNLQEGEYLVEAEVTNSYGDKAQIELPVWMVSRNDTLVNINLRSFLVYLEEGDSFYPRNYLSSVVLPDGSNGDIYDVEIKEQVDTAVPGSYAVQYSYDSADGDGFTVMVVVVKEKESENGTGN